MDQADIRTSVTSSDFWWAASAAGSWPIWPSTKLSDATEASRGRYFAPICKRKSRQGFPRRLPRCVAFWWNFPLARVVFAWPDVASPSVQLGLPVRWAGVTAPGLFLGSLCDHAETDARKFNSAPSRRRRMLSAGALSAGSTNPRSQGRRRGSASRFGCTAESRSSVPPRLHGGVALVGPASAAGATRRL